MAISIQRKRQNRKVAGVSMAPMIDMVFLLLVFFMTASAMSQSGSKLDLDLPESANAEVSQDFSGRLILSIDASGQTFIGTQSLSVEELASALKNFRESRSDGKLAIRAAKETPFSAVKEVMKQTAAAGIDDYIYASYQGGGS